MAAAALAINFIATAQTAPTFNFDLKARNATRGEAVFQESVTASAGDRILFSATVTAGSLPLSNVTLKNNMPAGLVFSTGEASLNAATGLNVGSIAALASKTVTFELIATSGQSITVNNSMTARADSASEKTDSVSVTISPDTVVARNLLLTNSVLNLTRGETSPSQAATANPGDRVRFEVKIEALGNATQTDVQLRFFPSSRLALASGDPNLFINGFSLGNMRPSDIKTITFEMNATSGDAVTTLNEARVFSAEVPEKRATSTVFVRGGNAPVVPPAATPPASSSVAGATTGQRAGILNKTIGADAAVVGARPGEVLSVSLTFTNTTAGALDQAVSADVKDLMTLAQITNTGSPAGVVDNGVIRFPNVTLTPGGSVTRTFEATVLPAGQVLQAADRTITLVYGSAVNISVAPEARGSAVAGATIVPPRTGASENVVLLLATLTTAGYWLLQRRKQLA